MDAVALAAYGEARQKAYSRAQGRCEVCGVRMDREAFHAHHRLPRRPRRIDCPCNLLALCHRCHAGVHQSPASARETGRIISRHDGRVPAMVPVRLMVGWTLLDHEGGFTHAAYLAD